MMKYFSTNRQTPITHFREAVLKSLPSDKGLYFPEEIPVLRDINKLREVSLAELGYEIMKPYVIPDIPENRLKELLREVLNFDFPLVKVEEGVYCLELFHGPTYAFKDVGASFLARCLGEFAKIDGKETTILVATSGDTGGAVADGFYGVEGVRVVILYPSGRVSELQEKQLTTLGGNITALEVDGDFDDCQALVKEAFLNEMLNKKLNLTSANSINIARWIPQSIYYAWMSLRLENPEELLIAVPSGNYGNVTAGILAKRMGFPLGQFLACSNANDVVPRYLDNCQYEVKQTVYTYANAMDVSDPSNFFRMLELYHHSFDKLTSEVKGFSLSDELILETIKTCKERAGYLLDPHGAIGYAGLKKYLKTKQRGVFLETAHPVKFAPTMEKALGEELTMPDFVKGLVQKEKHAVKLSNDFESLKEFLISS